MVEITGLLLYCAQQLGIALGVGAETVMLLAHRIALQDGVVDKTEHQFARATRAVMNLGVGTIVLSGFGVIAYESLYGNPANILEPAFISKWLLVFFAASVALMLRNRPVAPWIVAGIEGGSWYALFMVHILAPVAGWMALGVMYGLWMFGFMLCWSYVVFATRARPVLKKEPVSVKAQAPTSSPKAPEKIHSIFSFSLPKFPPKPTPAKPPTTAAQEASITSPQKATPAPAIREASATAHSIPLVQPPTPAAPVSVPAVTPIPSPAPAPAQTSPTIMFAAPKSSVTTPTPVAPTPLSPAVPDAPSLPAVRVMPKTPADVEKQRQNPVL